MNQRLMIVVFVLTVTVGLGLTGMVTTVRADEPTTVDLNSPEVMKTALEQQVGKRVKLKLESGQDVEGKVAKVGSYAVQLAELTGMEFFDATVKLEDIAAVIVKVRTK